MTAADSAHRWRRFVGGVLLALACVAVVPARAEEPGIRVLGGNVALDDGVYYLDARIGYRLSDVAREALSNGVPLVVELEIQVLRRRWWWWDAVVAELSQRYRLQYHALSQRYVLTAVNTRESRSFRSLRSMLAALGHVDALPLIDAQLLDKQDRYEVQLRARLDLDALPRPLRTVAYITPDWRLVSDWYQWRLDS
ncbi:MAG: DUF4390 domain-containing protein [Ectothiorhodospiraceae bacterium]|jgi:hypothetical protein